MPKNPLSKEPRNPPRLFSERNFVPFLNFQVKNELTFGTVALMNIKTSLEKNAHLLPQYLCEEFMDGLENISKAFNSINELTTLMRLLRDLRADAQPQKINPTIDFLPLLEKYRQEGVGVAIQASEDPIAGGKEEFKSILELLLANLMERRKPTTMKATLEVSHTYLYFYLEGELELFSNTGSMVRNEAYQQRAKTLGIIRMHQVRKIVEKWKGSITFSSQGMQIIMPVRRWNNGDEFNKKITFSNSKK